MSDSPQCFGDFVVGCERIIRGEVHRLARFGVVVPFADAVQDGFVALLERERAFDDYDGALARLIVRGILANRYIREPMAKKRMGARIPLDSVIAEMLPRAPSHENESIARVTLEMLDEIERLPVPSGRTRQARHQQRQRWIARVRHYVETGEVLA